MSMRDLAAHIVRSNYRLDRFVSAPFNNRGDRRTVAGQIIDAPVFYKLLGFILSGPVPTDPIGRGRWQRLLAERDAEGSRVLSDDHRVNGDGTFQ